ERHLPDLVQTEHPATRLLDFAGASMLARAGKAALGVSEKLACNQIMRDPAAIHRHEGALGIRAGALDRAGEQILANPRLYFDEDRECIGRQLARTLPRFPDRSSLAQDLVKPNRWIQSDPERGRRQAASAAMQDHDAADRLAFVLDHFKIGVRKLLSEPVRPAGLRRR